MRLTTVAFAWLVLAGCAPLPSQSPAWQEQRAREDAYEREQMERVKARRDELVARGLSPDMKRCREAIDTGRYSSEGAVFEADPSLVETCAMMLRLHAEEVERVDSAERQIWESGFERRRARLDREQRERAERSKAITEIFGTD
jgi:hypothetical protein